MKSLLQTVDGLVQRMQPGVVVNFEPISMNNQNVIGIEERAMEREREREGQIER